MQKLRAMLAFEKLHGRPVEPRIVLPLNALAGPKSPRESKKVPQPELGDFPVGLYRASALGLLAGLRLATLLAALPSGLLLLLTGLRLLVRLLVALLATLMLTALLAARIGVFVRHGEFLLSRDNPAVR
jgi:hypothetical protein